MLAPELMIGRAALLLVDMQNEFFRPEGPLARAGLLPVAPEEREELLTNVQSVLGAIREARRPVVHIKTTFRPGHEDCFLSPSWRQCVCSEPSCLVEGSWSAAILEEISPKKEDFVLTKKGHGAFQHTYLDRLLDSLNVDTCILAGNVLGSMHETLMQGGALGYENILITDASYPFLSPHLDTLRQKAFILCTAEVLAWIRENRLQVSEKPASKPCLIVVDIQNSVMHPDADSVRMFGRLTNEESQEIVENNLKLAAAMRARGFPVVYLKSVRGRDRQMDNASSKMRMRSLALPPEVPYHLEGSWGVEILDELKRQPGDFVVSKRSHSGFGTTHLHRLLRNLGVETIILTGGAVLGCLSETTREGVGLGYQAIVVKDATYPPNTRAIGMAALASRAEINSTEEALAKLAEGIW